MRHLFTQGLIQKDPVTLLRMTTCFTSGSAMANIACRSDGRCQMKRSAEMVRQLDGLATTDPTGFNHRQLNTITAAVAAR